MTGALRDSISAVLLAGTVGLALLYLTYAEWDRRQAVAETLNRMNTFMSTGRRFPLQYGLGLCERIRDLEALHDIPKPVDCDAIRYSIELGTSQAENNSTLKK